jgi:hypothetical protein
VGFKEGWKRFKREIGQELKHKFDQGRDEAANLIFTGRAYMPWPGPSQETLHQQAENALDLQEEISKVAGERAAATEPEAPEPNNYDKHASLYGVSYEDKLDEASQRGNNGNDQGRMR